MFWCNYWEGRVLLKIDSGWGITTFLKMIIDNMANIWSNFMTILQICCLIFDLQKHNLKDLWKISSILTEWYNKDLGDEYPWFWALLFFS